MVPKPDPETGDARFGWIRDGGKAAEVRERSAQLLARVRDRLRNRKVPTWLLGGLVALFTWRLGFPTPIIGLDPSWNAGLYMAVHRGLAFGTQIIFTYGPLGFLRYTGLWYSDLAVDLVLLLGSPLRCPLLQSRMGAQEDLRRRSGGSVRVLRAGHGSKR